MKAQDQPRTPAGETCYEVLVFGGYCCDLIITGLPEVPRLGADICGTGMGIQAGGAFNVVRALHRLGIPVGWPADFGSDIFSQHVLDEIRAEGVDDRLLRFHDHLVRNFSLSFSFTHERGFISYIEPVEKLDRAALVCELRPNIVLLDGLEYGPELLATAQSAHACGARVAMECQHGPETLSTGGLKEALQAVDLFLPNRSEAMQLTGKDSPREAAEVLAAYCPRVVVKLGPEGALAVSPEGYAEAPALPVQVLDTTGAGDCFNAGFLYGSLRGYDLLKCLQFGNICGGISTTAHGTIAAPDAAQAEEAFQRYYA
ncbi:MAG TPA: carbohydrate kinase family protein [Anaerolineaceae bacterium]